MGLPLGTMQNDTLHGLALTATATTNRRYFGSPHTGAQSRQLQWTFGEPAALGAPPRNAFQHSSEPEAAAAISRLRPGGVIFRRRCRRDLTNAGSRSVPYFRHREDYHARPRFHRSHRAHGVVVDSDRRTIGPPRP